MKTFDIKETHARLTDKGQKQLLVKTLLMIVATNQCHASHAQQKINDISNEKSK